MSDGGMNTDGGGPLAPSDLPATRAEAARFLTQATFGPTDAEVDRLMAIGYRAWLDEQFALPQSLHRLSWEAADSRLKATQPLASAGQREVLDSFWKQAVTGTDQLRQRVAFALSEILVISMVDTSVGESPQGAAGYLDMLGQKGFGNYRELLEAVSLHPMMGLYLSHIRNQKGNALLGRHPDENFAREVMQLFSIGLHVLNPDGTRVLGADGTALLTYSQSDVVNLARVFTGWSWACPAGPDINCFYAGRTAEGEQDFTRLYRAMRSYPQYHSRQEKRFLRAVIAPQAESDPAASLQVALDTLFQHPNVGPFLARQLIQRLVTSHPSPDYVYRVASAFANNGAGVRGDMKAVIRAVLLDPEARDMTKLADPTFGKIREPVVRLTNVLRALRAHSDSASFLVGFTDDPSYLLGQTPLRAPSVFNFFMPGHVPPGTQAGALGLTVPEMQLVHETSAAGYVNFMRDALQYGVGHFGLDARATRRDVQLDFNVSGSSPELALADSPTELVERMNQLFLYGQMPPTLRSELVAAVGAILVPVPNGSNQAQVEAARRNRVRAAALLTVASPEFIVQK
ncbi:DUF1800 domain-containing protein [Hyalangium gracile]|uniref:DUF1800 domain-containing protein n=1 Tax=Hyalangium gracile TaxID=394092 RepID=UPI001CCDCEBD|nr:DUF1800 domain-containing protein [Hyalangium gracile]